MVAGSRRILKPPLTKGCQHSVPGKKLTARAARSHAFDAHTFPRDPSDMAVMLRQPIVPRRRAAPVRPARAAGYAFALAAAALVAWQAVRAYEDAVRLQAHRDGLATLQRATSARVSVMTTEERTRHAQIEAVAKALATPASTLLDAIEARAPTNGITLKRIAYDARSGALELDVRASSQGARQDFVRSLAQWPASPGLGVPSLQQTPANGAASPGGLTFHVAARWSTPSTPAGRTP